MACRPVQWYYSCGIFVTNSCGSHRRCINETFFNRMLASKPYLIILFVDPLFRVWFQNNEPLMRALSKLINENEPELVLFVGEALVGNDGVNQLQMFNQVLH